MRSATGLRPTALAVLAAIGAANLACAAETQLSTVDVQAGSERAEGPVTGYRATRSSTFTKTDTPLKEVPASVTVVPATLMKDQAMDSMADVIRYVPGVTLHQGEGNRDQVVMRGNSTTADFFVDGMRDDAQVFRDLYNLERVEVLKGPGGMIFGRGGAGGVVNRVTKKPVFGHVGEASLTAGSWGRLRATADVGNKLGDSAAWRLNAMGERAGSFRDNVDLKRYAINPTFTWTPGPRTAVTVGYEHVHDDRTADRGVPSFNGRPFDTVRQFFGSLSENDARSTVDAVSAVVDHEFGGGLQLRNSFRAAHYDKFYQNVYPGSAVSAAGTLSLAAYNNANDRTNIFNQTDLVANFVTGRVEHQVLAGVELGHQDSLSQRRTGFFGSTFGTIGGIPVANPIADATRFDFRTTDANNRVRADIVGLYAQDQVAFNKRWKVVAGVRYDRFKVDFDDRRTTVTPTDLRRTDNGVSPRLGVIWTPTERSTYYASTSHAFLPSGEQLSLATTTADLAPEKAVNYEIGARWDLLAKLTLSAAAFRLDKDNVRSRDPSGSGLFVKTGQQRTTGVEIGLQGDVTAAWQVYGGYAHLNARVAKPLSTGTDAAAAAIPAGRKIALVPGNMLSLWNRFAFGPQWAAAAGVIHQSASYASISNAVQLPAFTRVDAALYCTVAGGRTRVALNVENLFNRRYFPTADGDNNISPGAPRSARVTVTTAF